MIHTGRFSFRRIFRDYPWTTVVIFFSMFLTIILVSVNFINYIYDEKIESDITELEMQVDVKHRITLYDHILTHTVSLYSLTGNPIYKTHYFESKKKLDESLTFAVKTPGESKADVEKAYVAYQVFVGMEQEAFKLVEEGKKDQAYALLHSVQYNKKKVIFFEMIHKASLCEQRELKAQISKSEQQKNIFYTIALISAICYLLSWVIFLLLVTRYSRDFSYRVDESLRNLSHDMRDPLSTMISYANILSNELDGPVNEKQNESLLRIQSVGKRLLNIIMDILSFSKLENKEIKVEIDQCEVVEMIHNSVMELMPLAQTRKIALEEKTKDSKILIQSDASKLSQILNNLISNAIKYTLEGTVTVQAEVVSDRVLIKVIDTGSGISKENLPHIFKPFFQVYEKKKEGLGLGLAISMNFTKLLGGELSVESEEGKGTTFILSLPKH